MQTTKPDKTMTPEEIAAARKELDAFASLVLSGDWDERLLTPEAAAVLEEYELAAAQGLPASEELLKRFLRMGDPRQRD